jgi:DNA repair protein RecO (recombination protein O)
MAARVSESFVLRSYPFREGDLIVSFLTRDQGKLRGVARRARRPKSPFGAGLERLSQVRMAYFQRENRELVNLESAELIFSPFDLQADYAVGLGLDYIAEVTEHLLPLNEPNERFFRLVAAMISHLRDGGSVWAALEYFSLWAVRLNGFLPELRIGGESLEIAEEMQRLPIAQLTPREWEKKTAHELRRLLVRLIEEHVERRLLTPPMIEAL